MGLEMSRLHLLHHRRLPPDDRRMAGRFPHMRTDMVLDAIEMARWNRGLHHTGLHCLVFKRRIGPRFERRRQRTSSSPSYSDDEVCVRRFTARISLCSIRPSPTLRPAAVSTRSSAELNRFDDLWHRGLRTCGRSTNGPGRANRWRRKAALPRAHGPVNQGRPESSHPPGPTGLSTPR